MRPARLASRHNVQTPPLHWVRPSHPPACGATGGRSLYMAQVQCTVPGPSTRPLRRLCSLPAVRGMHLGESLLPTPHSRFPPSHTSAAAARQSVCSLHTPLCQTAAATWPGVRTRVPGACHTGAHMPCAAAAGAACRSATIRPQLKLPVPLGGSISAARLGAGPGGGDAAAGAAPVGCLGWLRRRRGCGAVREQWEQRGECAGGCRCARMISDQLDGDKQRAHAA